MGNQPTVLDFLLILRRRWKLIVSTVAVAILLSSVISYMYLEKKYEATVAMIVQNQKQSDQVVYNDLLANQKLVKTYGEIIKSRYIAQDVISKLKLDMSPQALLNEVQVKAANDSLVTLITVTDRDPERVVLIANGFAESFNNNLNSIMKVDNVSILDRAKQEGEPNPVSPKPMVNIAISIVGSLCVAVAGSFLLEFLDTTVKNEDEVEELLGLPVLSVIAKIDEEPRNDKRRNSMTGGVL